MEIARTKATSVNADRWFRRIFQIVVFMLGLAMIVAMHESGSDAIDQSSILGTPLILTLVCTFLVVPISWAAADMVRRWIYPSAIYTRGFKDALQTRVFWAIGPQVITATVCCVFVSSTILSNFPLPTVGRQFEERAQAHEVITPQLEPRKNQRGRQGDPRPARAAHHAGSAPAGAPAAIDLKSEEILHTPVTGSWLFSEDSLPTAKAQKADMPEKETTAVGPLFGDRQN